MNGGKPRFHILDLVRGLAVFLMLMAHSVYFFHARDNSVLIALENFGNLFCFVAFLIVSGATTYVSYFSDSDASHKKRILSRIWILLLSYYLIALFVEAPSLAASTSLERLRIVFDIVALRNLPSYTEYIVPFLIFPLIILPFRKQLAQLIKKPWALAAVAASVYLAGYMIHLIPLPDYFIPWQALIAGSKGVFRFPILQYTPVFLLGIYWGHTLLESRGLAPKKDVAIKLTLIFALLFAALFYISKYFGLSSDIILKRWPPSVGFLLASCALTFFVAFVFYYLKRLNHVPILREFLLLTGQNAYSIFWAHIFLLSIYKFAGGELISSPWIFLFMFAVLWALVFALAIILPFNLKFALNFHRFSREDEEEFWDRSTLLKFEEEVSLEGSRDSRWLKRFLFPAKSYHQKKKFFRKRRAILIVAGSLVLAAILFPVALEEAKTATSKNKIIPWWDDSFGYRQNFTIKNQSPMTDIKTGQKLAFTINHKKLVDDNVAKPDGSDMRLLYWDTKSWISVPFQGNEWDKEETQINLTTLSDISGGHIDDRYFLYFGNFYCLNAADNVDSKETTAKYSALPGKITTHAINLKVGKRWNLIQGSQPAPIKISADSIVKLDQPKATYKIIDTALSGELVGLNGHFSTELPLKDLKPGRYQIQVNVSDGEKTYSSQKEWIFLSYPLYVAWTEDWEGYDVNESYLNAIENISAKYNVPVTHFWSPRIYDGSMSTERAIYLTNWLKNRLVKGDDIAFHLHMFYDYVTASGIAAKNEPRWDNTADGYSILTTAYTKDELKTLFSYGLNKFSENNLPTPIAYRAGGWFANLETLQAASESGFKVDSSGRTAYRFGSNNIPGPWNLTSTTQPYLPSTLDQNTGSITNHLSILEIPDNGADSYWFSGDDMIRRFKDNYDGSELRDKKQVTFLSHPHWFKEAEQDKVNKLFSFVSQYSNVTDSGPVVFTTTDKIYEAFSK